MDQPSAGNGRRETRLLLATIAVSVGMLMLLARFRFPEQAARQTVEPAPAPLERLAARATYDELAGIMADLERRISPAVEVLAVEANGKQSFVPAVRLAPERGIAVLASDQRLVEGRNDQAVAIFSRDAVRQLAVVRLPARPEAVVTTLPPARPGPRYVAVAEGSWQRLTVRPVYIGRTDLFADPLWTGPVLSVAASRQALPRGSAVFSLDGAFIGLAAESGNATTVIPAETLRTIVAASRETPMKHVELKLDVQPLTPELARASGADKGVMVSWVPPEVADGANLAAGDVIQAVDGVGVTTVAGFRQVLQSRAADTPIVLSIVRRGEPLTVTVAPKRNDAAADTPADEFGAVLRAAGGIGTEIVTVTPGTPAARADLRRGDLILAIDGREAPDPAAILRAYRAAESGGMLLLAIRRDTDHRMIAVEKP